MFEKDCCTELEGDNIFSLNNLENVQKQILELVALGKKNELVVCIDNLFGEIYLDKTLTIHCIRFICIDIILLICNLLSLTDGIVFNYEVKFMLYKQLLKNKTIQEIHKWMLDELTAAAEWSSVLINKTTTSIIKKIKMFVNTHYNENITTNMLAKEFYLTPNYISFIFKRETGETFHTYLTKVRIEKAKGLMENPKYKIYDIAHMVGYDDADYFGTLFKKHCKIKPTEYKRRFSLNNLIKNYDI